MAAAHFRRRLAAVGLRELEGGGVGLCAAYAPPRLKCRALLMVPHGRTPSNEKLLFQSHAESANSRLLPESLDEARAGADAFLDAFGGGLGSCRFSRSPLGRCAETARCYEEVFARRGLDAPAVAVDRALIEIDNGRWHGKTVDELAGAERAAAEAHRYGGDFGARPSDGESTLDVLERAAEWLAAVDERDDAIVVAFGHGMFQNAAEVVLRTYGDRPPADVFTRVPGASHLRRGRHHVLYDADSG